MDANKIQGHTPGPWKVCDDGFNVYAPDTDTAITNRQHPCAADDNEAEANAALIASAPALLAERDRLREDNARLNRVLDGVLAEKRDMRELNAELVDVLSKLLRWTPESGDGNSHYAKLRKECRAVIAKAEGGGK